MNLIIDIGNTRAKIAVFDKDKLVFNRVFEHGAINTGIKKLQEEYHLKHGIISSVSKVDLDLNPNILDNFIELDHQIKVPFINKYKTPTTLGVDRIALASAATYHYPKKNVLIIDSGTCITYDFINDNNEYLGGAISPGIQLRYKALHQFTANLPFLGQEKFNLIGNDTKSSIHSGVLNGFLQEIDGVIQQYYRKYSNLTVVLTGGDTNFLAKKLKSSIFASPSFLLDGLNSILIYNLNE